MKVLFICMANVGRSQMAEAIFNNMSDGRAVAKSAGVNAARHEGERLKEAGPKVVACMEEIGLDVSEKISKKLTEEMINDANIVVSMVQKEELPIYAQNHKKLILWDVEDAVTMEYSEIVGIRNKVYKNVEEFSKGLNRQKSKQF